MDFPGVPPFGRPEYGGLHEQQFGRRNPYNPLTRNILIRANRPREWTGRREHEDRGGMPGRFSPRGYDPEEEDDDFDPYNRPRFLGARAFDARRESLLDIPLRPVGMPPGRLSPMSEYGGRRGYGGEDDDDDDYRRNPMNRLGALLEHVDFGGRSLYDRGESPPPPRLGGRPGRPGSDGGHEYYEEDTWGGPVRPPRGGLRSPDGPGDFIRPPSRAREEPRFHPYGLMGNGPNGEWLTGAEDDELQQTGRVTGLEFDGRGPFGHLGPFPGGRPRLHRRRAS
jgi:hypothetical protein